MNSRKAYSVLGTWLVTTEGDCEGKSTKSLGVHYGYLDEIAFALADKCFYDLHFQSVDPLELNRIPKKSEVSISLPIDSGTWDLKGSARVKYFVNFFSDRPNVEVKQSNSYAGITIKIKDDRDIKKQRALSKLTEEDKKGFRIK